MHGIDFREAFVFSNRKVRVKQSIWQWWRIDSSANERTRSDVRSRKREMSDLHELFDPYEIRDITKESWAGFWIIQNGNKHFPSEPALQCILIICIDVVSVQFRFFNLRLAQAQLRDLGRYWFWRACERPCLIGTVTVVFWDTILSRSQNIPILSITERAFRSFVWYLQAFPYFVNFHYSGYKCGQDSAWFGVSQTSGRILGPQFGVIIM
jgi:hypothetical protein